MKFTYFFDRAWMNWSWISFTPMAICSVIRYFTQENYENSYPKCYFLDNIFRVMLFPTLIYYIIDTIVILTSMNEFTGCDFGYLFHHLVTIAGSKTILTLVHFPEFMMIPFTMHNVLLMFPKVTIFNYLYLALIFRNFFGLVSKPYKNIGSYRYELWISLTLVCGPLPILWWNKCSNSMDNRFN